MNRLPKKISLAAQTADVIIDEIAAGRWERWLPGEHELSTQLHVGRRTVRAALDQLQNQGFLICNQGKQREIIAPKIPRKTTRSRVVFLTPLPLRALTPFAIFLIDRLREHLAEEGYLLEIHSGRVPYRARLSHHLEHLEQTLHPAGWVLSQSTEQMQRWFVERKFPCVIFGSGYPDIALPSVDTDYAAVCRHAVGQLLAKGHRRIVLLNPKLSGAGDAKSETGFREAAATTRAEAVEATILHHDGTAENICSRLDGLLQRQPRPTALLVSRARHVLTVLGHLLSSGVQVPKDMALISRDDESFLADVVPSVARYSLSEELFASKISRAVMDVVQGHARIKEHKLMPTFIKGRTLG